jgi:Cadherin domain
MHVLAFDRLVGMRVSYSKRLDCVWFARTSLQKCEIILYSGQVLAVDADVNPSYARVIYSLRPTSAEFDLDSITGELRTMRSIDRELESVYLLYICAHDADKPVLHQCVNATVNIEDVNDNYPVVFDVSKIINLH